MDPLASRTFFHANPTSSSSSSPTSNRRASISTRSTASPPTSSPSLSTSSASSTPTSSASSPSLSNSDDFLMSTLLGTLGGVQAGISTVMGATMSVGQSTKRGVEIGVELVRSGALSGAGIVGSIASELHSGAVQSVSLVASGALAVASDTVDSVALLITSQQPKRKIQPGDSNYLKCVCVGDPCVGKTSLLLTILHGAFPDTRSYEPTIFDWVTIGLPWQPKEERELARRVKVGDRARVSRSMMRRRRPGLVEDPRKILRASIAAEKEEEELKSSGETQTQAPISAKADPETGDDDDPSKLASSGEEAEGSPDASPSTKPQHDDSDFDLPIHTRSRSSGFYVLPQEQLQQQQQKESANSRNQFHESDVADSLIQIELFDTSGDFDGYSALRPLHYRDADVFLVIFDLTRRATLKSVLDRWSNEVKTHSPNSRRLLVGTKSDLDDVERVVKKEEAEEVAKKIEAFAYLEISAATLRNLRTLLWTCVDSVFTS